MILIQKIKHFHFVREEYLDKNFTIFFIKTCPYF